MSKLIVVTGITGSQGGSVADVYLNTPGWKVRGITRNTSSQSAKSWQSKGVEMVQADVNFTDGLISAFKGANVVFGVTDFWTIFKDPESQKKKKPGQDITEYAYEVELQQGKNLADAAAANASTLERFIFSSMASAKKWSKGKFTTLYHMDSKAEVVDYINTIPSLKDKFSQVQAPIYYNLLWQWALPTTPKKQADGSYNIQGVGSGDIPVPFGQIAGDFGRCVKAVADSKPGLNLLARGQMLSWNQYLNIWTRSQNVPRGVVELKTLEEFMEILPGGLGREFGENVLFGQEFGYDGSDPIVIHPEDLGVKMTSFEEYCKNTDFSAIL
ncbi:putative NAD dependent epimerase/dehydratase [Xylogone sp. PMI_703]|nr:putative NAD dependent epimerase/dehydratase [Xylogone sp. PMI_703]